MSHGHMNISPLKQVEIWKSVQWLSAVLDEMLMWVSFVFLYQGCNQEANIQGPI